MNSRLKLKNQCAKIIKEIRKKYPSLKEDIIRIHTWRQPQGSMMTLPIFGYHIFIDYRKWAGANKDELTGTLAHELVHFEHNKKTSCFRSLFEFFLYLTSTKFRRNLERETDIITIKKGFGKELLKSSEFRIKMNKNYSNFMKKYYLMPNEVKSLMKKYKEKQK